MQVFTLLSLPSIIFGMKSATVSIIGRPSSGKSTLVNTICERKVSITARSPQTTRNAIRGIFTDSRGQLILTDTPGYHLNDQKMNLKLQETTRNALNDTDIILYVIDSKRSDGIEEQAIIEIIKSSKTPLVVAVNKEDIAKEREIEESVSFIRSQFPDSPVCLISAFKDTGVDELLIELFKLAPEGPMLYDSEAFTDQPLEFRLAEIIREKAIHRVSDEIPHAIFVDIVDIEHDKEKNSIWIRASINVEKESQKGILVGKGGEGIKKIRQESFKEIRQIFPNMKLQLDLRVKAVSKWRKRDTILNRLL
ncbi:MAG: GTPase Era [Sphaerochaetaceae bacterium]|nr:GTPase Era [Sphaerochaetaceae bacterium]